MTINSNKRILINYDPIGQIRVACIENQTLYDLEIEYLNNDQEVNQIYNAEIVSIEPSLEAAFANYGSERNGFLPLKEIAPEYYPDGQSIKASIKDVLFEGQKVLVQVNKEARGTKGAALSTYISLAGCYLVLMPNNPKAGGISRRIEGSEREDLKDILSALEIPEDMGVIIRTAGLGRSLEELQWDLNVLLKLWDSIKNASKKHGAPHLIYQENDIATRAVRDHLRPDVTEILIDNPELYEKVRIYVEKVRPDYLERVKLYQDTKPLFSRFNLEKQIHTAFQRKVRLRSGGEIVIDRTEALTSIDVNSAQATKGGHIEETALNTNLEAAEEIAKQLRLRDIGGLIIIDFIDMDVEENNHKVEERLRESLKTDRARIQLAHISKFGLLEMSRQRLRPALNDAAVVVCPKCHGQGFIRNVNSLALSIVHLIEEKATKRAGDSIHVQVPINIATYIVNEMRQQINKIESLYDLSIIVIPNPYLESPDYELEWNQGGQARKPGAAKSLSYELVSTPQMHYTKTTEPQRTEQPVPAVKEVLPEVTAPTGKLLSKPKKGVLNRLLEHLFGKDKKEEPKLDNHRPRHSARRPGGQSRYSKKRPGHSHSRSSQRRSSSFGGGHRRNKHPRDHAHAMHERQEIRNKPDYSSPAPKIKEEPQKPKDNINNIVTQETITAIKQPPVGDLMKITKAYEEENKWIQVETKNDKENTQ